MADIMKKMEPLLQKLFESELSAQESSELQQLVKSSKEARDMYLDYCQMHAMLNEEMGYLAGNVPEITSQPKIKKRALSPVFAMAALLALAGTILIFSLMNGKSSIDLPFRGVAVAKLSKSVEAEFVYTTEGNKPFSVGDSLPAGLYQLTNGVIQLDYENGASVVVESPAEFELLDQKNLGLREGKVSAVISEEAKNFTVQCSGVSIVDLGTEFSAYVEKGKFVEAHVFKGEVNVCLHFETADQDYEVVEGQAVRVLLGKSGPVLAGIDIRKDFFLRQMTQPESTYTRAVLSKNPVIYFPMDINADGKTLNDWSENKINGTAADVKDVSSLWAAGKVGSALRLSGSNHKSYVYVSDYPKTTNNKLTVVGWVYAESRPLWATIVKNWGVSRYGQFHFGLNYDGLLDVEIQNTYGQRFHITENSRKFPISQWQHVAFVHDGKTVKVYRNGVIVALGEVEGVKHPVDLRKMSIGTKLDDNELHPSLASPGHWDGRLDEIAIFNKALSDVDIEELYRLAIQND